MTSHERERAVAWTLLGEQHERASVLQWVGLFLAPVIFFAHLQIGYVLVPWSCTRHTVVWMHVVNLLSVAVAVVGTWIAWRVHARGESAADNDGPGTLPRTRFLGVVGLGTSAMFVLLLLAQAIEAISLSPCQ
jgi:hypothetical protein